MIRNKNLNKALSLVFYGFGAICGLLLAKAGMLSLTLVKAAMITPDVEFTNKVLYANLLSLALVFVLMYVATQAFKMFFNLGLYYWKLGFKGDDKE